MGKLLISTDNPDLKNKLVSLVALVQSHGAFLDKNLHIIHSGTQLSVHINNYDSDFKKLIEIPISLMPEINDYEFTLKNEKIVCKPKRGIDTLQSNIMQLMIEIYNETDKIREHKNSNLFYNLKNHKEFLKYLLHVEKSDKVKKYLELLDENKIEELLLESFFLQELSVIKKIKVKKRDSF